MATRPFAGLRAAVVANVAGSIWSAAISILFVPFYLKYLGASGYGLVGFSVTLLSIFTFLDGGLTLTVNRELARLTEGEASRRSVVETLSAGVTLFGGISALIALGVWAVSPVIATDWLSAAGIPSDEVVLSLRLIGLMVAEQLFAALLQSALYGLHRQVATNAILIGTTALRAGGAYLALRWVSPTPSTFFVWCLVAYLVQIVALWVALSFTVGSVRLFALPRLASVVDLLRKSRGLGLIAILALLQSQTDKVVVSRLLPLRDYGYYMVAVSVSLLPLLLAVPVAGAAFPRMSRMAVSDEAGARQILRLATQSTVAIAAPAGLTAAFFSREIIFAWTGNVYTTAHVAPIVSLLIGGYMITATQQVSYYFELAHARTRPIVIASGVALVLILPMMLILGRQFGAPGIASCWLLLNLGSLLVSWPLILRPGLGREFVPFYVRSLLAPCAAVLATVGVARLLIPDDLSRIWGAGAAVGVAIVAGLVCLGVLPSLRSVIIGRGLRGYLAASTPS